ncbi:hypothetical protein E2C01_043706 [Portunus trituberculatus]|uniref:Uncharacterized protein n=1 Tax=Portunus trituberculatus TaxID=210409 RepID=A0A5B7FQY4_PORTR|nr:hypothetical protein [Portunus trituberculatus]
MVEAICHPGRDVGGVPYFGLGRVSMHGRLQAGKGVYALILAGRDTAALGATEAEQRISITFDSLSTAGRSGVGAGLTICTLQSPRASIFRCREAAARMVQRCKDTQQEAALSRSAPLV